MIFNEDFELGDEVLVLQGSDAGERFVIKHIDKNPWGEDLYCEDKEAGYGYPEREITKIKKEQ